MFNIFGRFASGLGRVRNHLPKGLSVPWFRDRSIGLKIGVGFGVILLFFLSAGATTYHALQSASDGFVGYRAIARSTNLLAKIQTDLLNIRDTVKDYLITGSEDALKSYDSHITATRARLASTKSEMDDPERIARLAEVESKLARYDEAFGQIVALRKKRDHLVDDVIYVLGSQMGEQINDLFQRFQATGNADALYQLGNALKYLNTGRLYVSRFLDTGDAAQVDSADSELFLFEDYLFALEQILDEYSLKTLEDIKQSLASYKDALAQAVGTVQRQDVLAEEIIEQIGPDVADTIGDLTDSIRVRQDSLGPKLVARNASATAMVAGLLAAALLLGTLIALSLARSIALPLRRATKVMEHIRLGQLDQRVNIAQKDEVGRLARAVDDFADTLAAFSELLRRMGQGDFSMQVPLQSAEDEMGRAAQQMVEGVRALAMGARRAAEQVNAGAEEMLGSSQSLSQAATQQAASVEEITSTMQVIGSQARTNADNAVKAHALGQEAETSAQSGVREMDGLVGAMHDLNESSRSIARIIKVIDEIAFQTNLLALNAAVEAARAGKHGRGFAVVANEVRNLASRSAKAAEETETLIEATLGKVAQGTKQANRTAEMLDEIVDIGHRSAVLVGEIATASEEQAKGAAEVGIALDQVQSVTQDNTAQAEEVTAAATELSSQSQALRRLINRFRIGDGRLRELPASAPDEYAGTEAPETEAQGAPRAGVPPANLPPVDPVHAAMAPAETDPQDATTEATETTETAAVPEDAETRDADADIREDADPSAEAESDPAAAAHGANQETAQNASQGENPPREKLDEFVLPDQVIALDDEEFGRY